MVSRVPRGAIIRLPATTSDTTPEPAVVAPAETTDPAVATDLTPVDHPIGTKRICTDDGYYATFNRENVCLVDIRSTPIEAITPTGVRVRGKEYASTR